ncbi:MAG: hypothetical protein ACOYWZ_21290 [Bacillota bacterium]
MENFFLINVLKAFGVLGLFGFILGLLCFIAVYFIDEKEVRESKSNFSTTLGNALFIVHSIFEPGKKPQTEQVIWVKKRRTPVERRVLGLSELNYDKIHIKGYSGIKNKRYVRKSGL